MVEILDNRSSEWIKISITQVQVDYQTKEWHIIANVLKYRSDNLIILYCYIYSGLLGTMGAIVWNSLGLTRNTRFIS